MKVVETLKEEMELERVGAIGDGGQITWAPLILMEGMEKEMGTEELVLVENLNGNAVLAVCRSGFLGCFFMKNIADDVYYVGVNDRTTDLFESVWPVPEGISYNSYLIRDEKTALMDTVKGKFTQSFFSNIEKVTDLTEIDYLVIHHMEPDHSGSIVPLREMTPNIEIIGTEKTMHLSLIFCKVFIFLRCP